MYTEAVEKNETGSLFTEEKYTELYNQYIWQEFGIRTKIKEQLTFDGAEVSFKNPGKAREALKDALDGENLLKQVDYGQEGVSITPEGNV